jgi:hypothetical protein
MNPARTYMTTCEHYAEAERLSWVIDDVIQSRARRTLSDLIALARLHLELAQATGNLPGPDQPVPYTLTPKAHAALANPGGFPPVVCLCGSTRFVDEFNRQRRELTERGQIVLAIEIVTTQARHDDPQHADPALKARLDELHKRKIDLADYVLVLNVGGYVGDSTRSEIAYAAARGKPVRYLHPGTADPSWHGESCTCPHCAPWDEWACEQCGAAYLDCPPEDGLCPGCRAAV